MPGTLREVFDNNIIPGYKISLNWLGMKKSKSGGLSIIMEKGMEVAQDYNVFN